jgi:hypothetical protein
MLLQLFPFSGTAFLFSIRDKRNLIISAHRKTTNTNPVFFLK